MKNEQPPQITWLRPPRYEKFAEVMSQIMSRKYGVEIEYYSTPKAEVDVGKTQ